MSDIEKLNEDREVTVLNCVYDGRLHWIVNFEYYTTKQRICWRVGLIAKIKLKKGMKVTLKDGFFNVPEAYKTNNTNERKEIKKRQRKYYRNMHKYIKI